MEKRFILAVILSFAFLYVWGLLTKPSQPIIPEVEEMTISSNKEQKTNTPKETSSKITTLNEKSQKNTQHIENKEFTLKSDVLRVTFSDIGAAITSVLIKQHDAQLPLRNIAQLRMFSDERFDVEQKSDLYIIFRYRSDDYEIRKEYILDQAKRTLDINIYVKNISKMSKMIAPEFLGYKVDSSSLDINGNDMVLMRDKTLFEYTIKEGKKYHRKSKAYAFTEKDEYTTEKKVDWVAFRDRYFSAIVKPKFAIDEGELIPNMKEEFLIEEKGFFGSKTKSTRLDVVLKPEQVEVQSGETHTFSWISYIGPEEMSKLKPIGYDFEKVKRYYRFGLFDFAGKLINQIFHLMYKVVPSWGFCIILLSIIVYFSMYPLTKKSMMSMRKMQAVAPKINALKAKHKDNPQKLNAEMMDIYRKEKINPAGGCLPIILQMPIFLGLYQVLWRSVSIKGSNFLWINDLTDPDRLMILPFTLPVIGNELNILPILMVVIMFFQQRFSMRNITPADPMQAQQQKIMSVMMPFLIGFIFYKFSAGLTLYFTLFYAFSTLTQWKMAKQIKVG